MIPSIAHTQQIAFPAKPTSALPFTSTNGSIQDLVNLFAVAMLHTAHLFFILRKKKSQNHHSQI